MLTGMTFLSLLVNVYFTESSKIMYSLLNGSTTINYLDTSVFSSN